MLMNPVLQMAAVDVIQNLPCVLIAHPIARSGESDMHCCGWQVSEARGEFFAMPHGKRVLLRGDAKFLNVRNVWQHYEFHSHRQPA